MTPRTLFTSLLIAILVYFLFSWSIIKPIRQLINSTVAVPLLELSGYMPETAKQKIRAVTLKLDSRNRQIEVLKSENSVLRKQLGSIPEKTTLTPGSVIFHSDTDYTVTFTSTSHKSALGAPVIVEDIFVGKIIREQGNMLVVQKPFSTIYSGEAVTEGGVTGKVNGEFNESVVFETGVEESVLVGETIYIVDKNLGFKSVLGKVLRIEKNARLPTKKAYVDYLPDRMKLTTVFIVL